MMDYFKNPGVQFILKFICLFLLLYYFNVFYFGVTDPRGLIYSTFLAKYLNYLEWARVSILHGGSFFSGIIGLNTTVVAPHNLKIINGAGLYMADHCIGVGIMSFWAAFVIANHGSLKKKLLWTAGGISAIWFINCWRMALLLLTVKNKGNVNRFAEHHTMFNIAAYILIFFMIYLYTKYDKAKKEPMRGEAFAGR